MRWRIRKSFKIFAAGSSLRTRVAYKHGNREVDSRPRHCPGCLLFVRDGPDRGAHRECRCAGGKAAAQPPFEMLEARRARETTLCSRTRYLQRTEFAREREGNSWLVLGILSQTKKHCPAQSGGAHPIPGAIRCRSFDDGGVKARTVERIQVAVLAYERDFGRLVKKARHEKRAELMQNASQSSRIIGLLGLQKRFSRQPRLTPSHPRPSASSEQTLQTGVRAGKAKLGPRRDGFTRKLVN